MGFDLKFFFSAEVIGNSERQYASKGVCLSIVFLCVMDQMYSLH